MTQARVHLPPQWMIDAFSDLCQTHGSLWVSGYQRDTCVLVIINQLFSTLRGLSGNTASPFSAHLPALWGRAGVTLAALLCCFGNRDDWGALCNGIEFLAGGKETAMRV